jgi:hypothetical protein
MRCEPHLCFMAGKFAPLVELPLIGTIYLKEK